MNMLQVYPRTGGTRMFAPQTGRERRYASPCVLTVAQVMFPAGTIGDALGGHQCDTAHSRSTATADTRSMTTRRCVRLRRTAAGMAATCWGLSDPFCSPVNPCKKHFNTQGKLN